MHSGLRRSDSNRPKVSDRGKCFLPRKSVAQKLKASTEDHEAASVIWGNPNLGYSRIKFLIFEPDGHWGLLALPFLCPHNSNNLGSGLQPKMDNLIVVSPPDDSVKTGQHDGGTGSLLDAICSAKSLTDGGLSHSDVHHRSGSESLTNKAVSLDDISKCDTSGMISDNFDAANSSETSIDSSRAQKNAKKNARRKARKKAKQKKKISSDAGSTEPEILCEDTLESSTSETSLNNGMDHGYGPASYESIPVNSLTNCLISINDSEGDSNGITNSPGTSELCSSDTDDMDVSEDTATSVIHNFKCEHPAFNSEDGIQTKDLAFSSSKGLEDKHGEAIHSCGDMSSNDLSNMPDLVVLDSVSVGCRSEDSTTARYSDNSAAGYIVSPSNKEVDEISDFEAHQNTRNAVFSHQSSSNRVDPCTNGDRMTLHYADCSGSDMQLDLCRQRVKQDKIVVESAQGCVGKESVNHFQLDKMSKEAPLLKKNCNNVEVNVLSKSEDKNRSKVKVHRKSGKNSISASKPEYDCHSRKRSVSMKASSNSNAPARTNIQGNQLPVFPVLCNDQNESGGVAPSYSQNDCAEPEVQTNGEENITYELVHTFQDCTGNLEPLERCSTMSTIKDHITEDQNTSLLESLDSSNMPNPHEDQSAVRSHPIIGKEVSEVAKEVSLSENKRQEHSSASVVRKWKPTVKKDSGFANFDRSDMLLLAHAAEPAAEGWTPKNSLEEKPSSNSQKHISSNESEKMCVDRRSGDVNHSSPEDKSPDQNVRTSKQLNDKHAAVNCFAHACKEKHVDNFGVDSSKISRALHDAFRVEQLSESAQLATGGSIADFEILLHAASPIICQSNSVKICQTCSRDEVGKPLCPHEIPNITLRNLWKWYKKHGSYGLAVRLADCEYSQGLGFHHSAFQTYFVPYLSAVQLFRKPKSHCMKNAPVVSRACEASKTSESSVNIAHLPIFKILIPRPHAEKTSFGPLENRVYSSQASSMSQPVDTTTDDLELLFEYFESDQPQVRKPLFDKIKELVRGDGPSWYKPYGDPTKLESMNLDELHHISWYSVAWYPIYRIPDGEFRAAFLTYHSFGHLVRRGSAFNFPRKDACVISPVVGLQSYNAQRERWFHLKQRVARETEETLSPKPSEILRERLKTLEKTASLLSRAEVRKGNLKSVNKHPDYEFFLSRQRW